MDNEISKSKFKAQALKIFRQVELSGAPVIITDHGRRKLVLRKLIEEAPDPLQRLRQSILRYDDPTAPVAEDDWNALT